MTGLLETCGQGGIADAAHQEAYDSSFLIADPTEAFVLETAGSDYAVAPFPAGVGHLQPDHLGTEWTRASGARTGDDFDRFRDPVEDTAFADVRLAASRRFLASTAPGGLTPAATAAHLRDHGTGPWGAPGTAGPVHLPPDRGRARTAAASASACTSAGVSVTAASMIAELSPDLADGAPLRVYVAAGSPCASIYVPAFPRTAAGPPPFVPFELSGEELWHAADALRQLVEADPDALPAVREALQPVEDELWAEADDVLEDPARWAEVGASWGGRALACAAVLYPLIVVGRGGTLRQHARVCSYSPRGMS